MSADLRCARFDALLRTYAILVAFALLGTLAWPLGPDQGILASVGHKMLAGGMPYRDAFDLKGPLSYVPFALSELLLGSSQLGIRSIDLAINIAFAAASVAVFARAGMLRVGIATAATLQVLCYRLGFENTAQPDQWVASSLLLLLSLSVATKKEGSRSAQLISGVLVGGMSAVKPFYALFGIIGIYLALQHEGWERRMAALLSLLLGALGTWALVLGYLALGGGLQAWWHDHIVYALFEYRMGDVGHRMSLSEGVRSVFWDRSWGKLLLVALPTCIVALAKAPKAVRVVVTAGIAVSVLCLLLGGRYFPYQFVPIFPYFAYLLALACVRGLTSPTGRWLVRSQAMIVILIVTGLLAGLARGVIVDGLTDTQSAAGARRKQLEMVAARVREVAGKGGQLSFWGFDPSAIWLSGVENSSRFVFAMPLVYGASDNRRRQFRAEFALGLQSRRNALFVVDRGFIRENGDRADPFNDSLLAVIASNYRSCGVVLNLELFVPARDAAHCGFAPGRPDEARTRNSSTVMP